MTLDTLLPVTPFVGRDQELAEITHLLSNPACRLLTLVGPGGIGKTRLALETARLIVGDTRHIVSAFPNGVHVVPLQPLTSPDFMASAIADSVGFQFSQGDPKQQLLRYFQDKSMLLLLDNLEHLLDGVHLLSEILSAAPGVRILATSRERLNLLEEWVLDVGGLIFPISETEADIDHYNAVELFLQHARRVSTSFMLSDLNKPPIVRICRLVEGMPLAIELAAAWVRALSPDAIASEIADSLDILETPARNIEPRHRTMRAAFEPTWRRLTEVERNVFMKLSVFRGGFTREAAGMVAGATLRTLTALVDKSLLRVDANGRYDIHELLRQYAEDQAYAAPDEHRQTHDRHCAFYATFLHQQMEYLKGKEIKQAVTEISCEIDNVRTAWRWATDQGRLDDITSATHALWFYYHIRGWLQEGEQAFARAVRSLAPIGLDEKRRLLHARLLTMQANFDCYVTGRPREASSLLQDSLAIFHQCESRWDLAFCLATFASVASVEGNYEAVRQYYQQALNLFREIGDSFWIANILGRLGLSYHWLGEDHEAKSLIQQSLALFQDIESFYGFAVMQLYLAFVALAYEEYEEAREWAEKCLIVGREIGLQWVISGAHIALADAACAAGNLEQAWRFARQAFSWLWTESRDIPGVLWVLPSIANLLAIEGEKVRALELLALAIHHPATHGDGRIGALRHFSKLEVTLSSDMVTAAIERGKSLELEAVTKALTDDWILVKNQSFSHAGTTQPLSDRELEILGLIADGLSNREIAEHLILAMSTVKWYINQVFGKLHVTNRTQAVARARAMGLLV